MSAALAIATAVVFVWLGMVLAISFLEAPLKFRTPGLALPVGLAIGRIVFRALNAVEVALAAVLAIALVLGRPAPGVVAALAAAVVTLLAQLLLVRPQLTRRTNDVLAGKETPRSKAHHAYVALELVKVITLVLCGVLLLNG